MALGSGNGIQDRDTLEPPEQDTSFPVIELNAIGISGSDEFLESDEEESMGAAKEVGDDDEHEEARNLIAQHLTECDRATLAAKPFTVFKVLFGGLLTNSTALLFEFEQGWDTLMADYFQGSGDSTFNTHFTGCLVAKLHIVVAGSEAVSAPFIIALGSLIVPIGLALLTWILLQRYDDDTIDRADAARERATARAADNQEDSEDEHELHRLENDVKWIDSLVIVNWSSLYALHTTICINLLSAINCTWNEVDGKYLLLKDSAVECWAGTDALWQTFFLLVLLTFFVVPWIPVIPLTAKGRSTLARKASLLNPDLAPKSHAVLKGFRGIFGHQLLSLVRQWHCQAV